MYFAKQPLRCERREAPESVFVDTAKKGSESFLGKVWDRGRAAVTGTTYDDRVAQIRQFERLQGVYDKQTHFTAEIDPRLATTQATLDTVATVADTTAVAAGGVAAISAATGVGAPVAAASGTVAAGATAISSAADGSNTLISVVRWVFAEDGEARKEHATNAAMGIAGAFTPGVSGGTMKKGRTTYNALTEGTEVVSDAGRKGFRDQMSHEDTARYDQYWKNNSAGSGYGRKQTDIENRRVLKDGEGASEADMAASIGGPTGGSRAGQAKRRKELIDEANQNNNGIYNCWRCGETSINPDDMHLGHRNVPTSKGGNLSEQNTCLEGASCNLSSGNRGAPKKGMSCAERGSCGAPYRR